ncbi:MAG: hypothetical protein VKJ04_02435 [Vampirovibrionales bacterium]|nr:hypothetical protein [Vampirovibrionales bacterium]
MAQAAIRRERPHVSRKYAASQGAQVRLVKPARSPRRRNKFGARLVMLFMATVTISLLSLFTYMQHQTLILETVKFPCRIVTCAVSAVVGAVNGGINGVIEAERQVVKQTFAKADEDPLLIPAGIMGVAIAVPVGIAMGIPDDVMSYTQQGYHWWDTLG